MKSDLDRKPWRKCFCKRDVRAFLVEQLVSSSWRETEKRPREGRGRHGTSDTATTNHRRPTNDHLQLWGECSHHLQHRRKRTAAVFSPRVCDILS